MRPSLEAPFHWLIVGDLTSPPHSSLHSFSVPLSWFAVRGFCCIIFKCWDLLTPAGNNDLCLATCRADPGHFLCPRRSRTVSIGASGGWGVGITLFHSEQVVWPHLLFSLWIPFKGNQLLLFGCLAPQKCYDMKIILGKFNFGGKCIDKKGMPLAFLVYIFLGKPFAFGVSLFLSLTDNSGDSGWCWRLRIPLRWSLVRLASGEVPFFFPILGKLWLLNQVMLSSPVLLL